MRFRRVLSVDPASDRFIRIRASGWLGAADYRRFERAFAEALKRRRPPVPLLLDLRGFQGWTPAGFVHDLAWDLHNRRRFSAIAVVGDRSWHRWITILGRPLFRAPMNVFRDEKTAVAWLKASARS
jgi:hypothetical protein